MRSSWGLFCTDSVKLKSSDNAQNCIGLDMAELFHPGLSINKTVCSGLLIYGNLSHQALSKARNVFWFCASDLFFLPPPLNSLSCSWRLAWWENKSPKQAWREPCRVWSEIKDVIHSGLSEHTESLKCLQGAGKDSFQTCPPDPYSQRAPKERDLLGLECLARLLCLLNMTGNMESICCLWPHFPLGFMAQKPEYSSWAHKSSLDSFVQWRARICAGAAACCADRHRGECSREGIVLLDSGCAWHSSRGGLQLCVQELMLMRLLGKWNSHGELFLQTGIPNGFLKAFLLP